MELLIARSLVTSPIEWVCHNFAYIYDRDARFQVFADTMVGVQLDMTIRCQLFLYELTKGNTRIMYAYADYFKALDVTTTPQQVTIEHFLKTFNGRFPLESELENSQVVKVRLLVD